MISRLIPLKWQIISGVSTVALILTAGALVFERVQTRNLTKQRDNLSQQLVVEKATTIRLTSALDEQSQRMRELSERSAAQLETATNQLRTAQAATRRAESRAAVLLSQRPRGNTLEERVRDVDNRVLESLR